MTSAYTTGTITLVNGSAAIVGTGTGWATAVIAGGVIYPAAAGNALPIAEIVDDTHIMAAVPWAGASGTYAYALMRDTSYAAQTVANAQALATYIAHLNSVSLSAIASVAGSMEADKLLYTVSDTAMDWTTLTPFARTLLDDEDAEAARVTLGGVLTATAGAAAISTAGGSLAALTTSPEVRLSINFTATRSSILALASLAIRNAQAAEPWVTGKLMIQDLVTMSEFVAHEFNLNVPGTNSGRYYPIIPLMIAYSGLVIGRQYQIKLYVWTYAPLVTVYPGDMKIVAYNS